MTNRFRLIHGDALATLPTIADCSIDAIITDPPYSSGGLHRGDRAKSTGQKYTLDDKGEDQQRKDFGGDQRDQRAFGYWCSLWLSECFRVAKDGAMLAIFCDWRQLPLVTDVVQAGGWTYRGIIPWNKTEATRPNKGWFRAQCEYLVVAAKGTPARWADPDAPALAGFMVCPVEREQVHQTQKPLSLMRWLCQIPTPGATILDPFAGSGTTGVAALLEGHQFIGCEMTKHYHEIATARLAEAATQGTQQTIAGIA